MENNHFLIGDTSSNGGFPIAMLVYRSVPLAEIGLEKSIHHLSQLIALTSPGGGVGKLSAARPRKKGVGFVSSTTKYRKLESLAQQKWWETTMGKTWVKTQVSRGKVRRYETFYHSFLSIVCTYQSG